MNWPLLIWLGLTSAAVYYSFRLVHRYWGRFQAARELADARGIVARDTLLRELVRLTAYLIHLIVGLGALLKAPGLAQLLIAGFGLLLVNSWLENRGAERLDRILEEPDDSYR
jgi:hypothetical protein